MTGHPERVTRVSRPGAKACLLAHARRRAARLRPQDLIGVSNGAAAVHLLPTGLIIGLPQPSHSAVSPEGFFAIEAADGRWSPNRQGSDMGGT
jgi:hypothetical protein